VNSAYPVQSATRHGWRVNTARANGQYTGRRVDSVPL